MSGLLACFPVTSEMLSTWQLRYPLAAISVVVSTYPFESFTPVGELYDLNATSVCINVTGQNVTYLVAGLIDDWSSVTVDHTWPYEQLGLVIFTAIVYFLLLVWILYSLVMHLSYDYYILKDTHKSVYLKLGLLMIATQSTLRVIYFVGSPFGVFSEETLSILFSDLPQLLFHGAVVLAGVMWEAIVAEADPNMNKTHTALSYFYISTLFLAFLGLNIAYGALSPKATQQFTCGTTQEEKDQVTAAEAVGYTYRAIFALYSALIAISFSIQSFRIVQLLHKLYAKRGKQGMNHLILTFGVTSVLSICGLLIQAAIAIYSAIADLKNETKLALILTCEVLPTYALAYLMRYKAPWKAYKTFTSSHSRGSSSSKRSRQNNAPSTGSHN